MKQFQYKSRPNGAHYLLQMIYGIIQTRFAQSFRTGLKYYWQQMKATNESYGPWLTFYTIRANFPFPMITADKH
jgi:hypothetical protein